MVDLKEKSAEFWMKRAEYPPFPYTATRRKIDVDYLLSTMEGVESVVDVGCGDGALIKMLGAAHPDIHFHGMDLGSMWLFESQGRAGATFEQRDVFNGQPYPEADLTIASGVLNYAFSWSEAENFIASVRSPRLYLRMPCAIGYDEMMAEGHSDVLGDEYQALYRTVEQVLRLLKTRFDVPTVFRIYPDSIESEFGTKQFVFEAVGR